MKVQTREALKAFEERFGKGWPSDLSNLKHSEENALVAEITEAMKKPVRKKRSIASQFTGEIVE